MNKSTKLSPQNNRTTPRKSISYLDHRLNQLGLSRAQNIIKSPNYLGLFGQSKIDKKKPYLEFPLFELAENDNIKINYYSLTGRPYTWKKKGTKFERSFSRIRFKVPKIIDENGKSKEQKYHQETGSGTFPFFNQRIIDAYLNKKQIETLILIEGEFKSISLWLAGLDVIGIPSIHGFYDPDPEVRRSLHSDIQAVIETCNVKNILYLTDADTLVVKWEKGKDLSRRQYLFYLAIKYFRESLDLLLGQKIIENVYFSHVKTQFHEDAKGVDDLILKYKDDLREIINDLLKFQFSSKYFTGRNITDGRSLSDIMKYFGLKDAAAFYQLYSTFIGDRQFVCDKRRYEWNGEEVVFVRHEDSDKFMRIGPDWIKIIRVKNNSGEFEEEIKPWKISEIQRDYLKIYPDFIVQCQKYDSFCNEPAWDKTYKRVHGNCYNLVHPLIHQAKPGPIEHTLKYLKHVFQGKAKLEFTWDPDNNIFKAKEDPILGDPFTVILDWLTIIHRFPKQKMISPVLVSQKQETGKTTFLKWLETIYGNNAITLDNAGFKTNFNAHYIYKFIIGIDERFSDVEKDSDKERIKQLITSDYAWIEFKGMNRVKIAFHGHLVLCGNNADRIMKLEKEDRRWFVVNVPEVKNKDPHLPEKLKAEIPAWLNFIETREIFHPHEAQLWFKTEYIITEQFRIIMEMTKNRLDKVIEGYIKDMIKDYRLMEFRIHKNKLVEELNRISGFKVDGSRVEEFLKSRNMEPDKTQRYSFPTGWREGMNGELIMEEDPRLGRPYIFKYNEWLTEEDMKEFIPKNISKKAPF